MPRLSRKRRFLDAQADEQRGTGKTRSASQLGLVRSNSTNRLGTSLKNSERNIAGESASKLAPENMEDFSSIAIYSREASENFGRRWKNIVNSTLEGRVTTKSKLGVSSDKLEEKLNRLSTTTVKTGFEHQIQTLLQNRMTPHVIAVIEGKQERPHFSLNTQVKGKTVPLEYSEVKFKQGRNKLGGTDNKQSMSIYIRKDMNLAYSAVDVPVPFGDGGQHIPCIGIRYSAGGVRYETLIVHIPHEFLKPAANIDKTKASFLRYAQDAANYNPPVIVTAYTGDTNFMKFHEINTTPSIAGLRDDGQTFHYKSSSGGDTHFMQSIPLSVGDSRHAVLQPAALNTILLNPDDKNKEGTDHPSMIHFTAHSSPISNRNPGEAPEYYMSEK